MKKTHVTRMRRGIFLADTMVGFAITTILALVLVTAVTKARRAEIRLDEGAAAVRLAQRALTDLQQGKKPAAADGDEVKVNPAAGAATIAGKSWVEVSVHHHGRTASLVGLIPIQGGAQ